eukprot:6580278-Pyramimonas_sp.AAC.1
MKQIFNDAFREAHGIVWSGENVDRASAPTIDRESRCTVRTGGGTGFVEWSPITIDSDLQGAAFRGWGMEGEFGGHGRCIHMPSGWIHHTCSEKYFSLSSAATSSPAPARACIFYRQGPE